MTPDTSHRIPSALREQATRIANVCDTDWEGWAKHNTATSFPVIPGGEIDLLECQFPLENDEGRGGSGNRKSSRASTPNCRAAHPANLGPEYVHENPLTPLDPESADEVILTSVGHHDRWL